MQNAILSEMKALVYYSEGLDFSCSEWHNNKGMPVVSPSFALDKQRQSAELISHNNELMLLKGAIASVGTLCTDCRGLPPLKKLPFMF